MARRHAWASTRSRPRILKERKFLLASSTWPGGIPEAVQKARRRAGRPRPRASRPPPWARARRSRSGATTLRALGRRQRRARRGQGHRVGLRLRPPRRHHLRPVPGPRRRSSASWPPRSASPTARTSCSAASPRTSSPILHQRLAAIGMAEPGAELARDVVACPGADTCNLAVTQTRGLADAIGAALEDAGLADVGGVRTNISGCTNSLRPAPHRRHRLLRRRAPGPRPVAPPATRCCSAATSARRRSTSARRPCACRPRTRPRPPSGSSAGSPTSARPARPSAPGWTAPAAPRAIADDLKDLDEFPTPEDGPEYYVDYGETGPYVAEIGDSECAT